MSFSSAEEIFVQKLESPIEMARALMCKTEEEFISKTNSFQNLERIVDVVIDVIRNPEPFIVIYVGLWLGLLLLHTLIHPGYIMTGEPDYFISVVIIYFYLIIMVTVQFWQGRKKTFEELLKNCILSSFFFTSIYSPLLWLTHMAHSPN